MSSDTRRELEGHVEEGGRLLTVGQRRGREVEVGMPGRPLQPPAESLFEQFMTILNDDNVTGEAKDKAATKFVTSRFEADNVQERVLGFIDALSEGSLGADAPIWKKMFDELTPCRAGGDASFLAAPRWRFRVGDGARITMLGPKDETLVRRHVTTTCVDRSGANCVLNLISERALPVGESDRGDDFEQLCPVGILWGASGQGKTMDGVLTAQSTDTVRAACARFTPERFDELFDPIERMDDKAARNTAVKKCALKLVKMVIPPEFRNPPTTDASMNNVRYRFVLFFDEMGCYPNFVRGLCAVSKDLNFAIRHKVVGMSTEVVILAGGTGVEGTNHAAGSEPSTYVMCNRTTNVWATLTCFWEGPKKHLKDVIDGRVSRTASLAADVVQNARAAAAFCARIEAEAEFLVSDVFIQHVTRSACSRYKGLNGLRDLSWAEYLELMCRAVAAQHATELDEVDFYQLARKYGVLTDNAMRAKHGDAAAAFHRKVKGTYDEKSLTHLWIPNDSPRYTMDPAQAAMMLSMFDLGDRAPTGEGFEEAGMDYTALCALIAYATTKPRVWSTPFLAPAAVALPRPWRCPIEVAHRLRSFVKRTQAPESIVIRALRRKVQLTTESDVVKTAFGADGMASGRFWLNAPKARGPDGFCFVGDRVLLMQFKFTRKTEMTDWDVFLELHKMGARTDECVVAAWLASLQESAELQPLRDLTAVDAVQRFEELRKTPETWTSVADTAYDSTIRKNLIRGEYLATFRQICDDTKNAATTTSFAAAIRTWSDLGKPAPFLEVFKKFTPMFVVMHCGATPHDVPQPFDGLDVLLVTAPADEMELLESYFPINVAVAGQKYVWLPMPTPPKPQQWRRYGP